MNPGATTQPETSTTVPREALPPTEAIRSPSSTTSPTLGAPPLPSTIVPPFSVQLPAPTRTPSALPGTERPARGARGVVAPLADDGLPVHEHPLYAAGLLGIEERPAVAQLVEIEQHEVGVGPCGQLAPARSGARGGPAARVIRLTASGSEISCRSREKWPRKRGIVPQNIGSGSVSLPRCTGTTAVSVSGIASGRATSRRSGALVLASPP